MKKRHLRLSLIALLILIPVAVPLVGCMSASEDEAWEDKYEILQIEDTILRAELQTAKADIDYLRTASNKWRDDYDTLKAQYDRLQADHITLEATSKKLQGECDSLKVNYGALQTDYDTTKASYDTVLAAQKTAYDSLQTKYNSLNLEYNILYERVKLTLPTYPTPTPTKVMPERTARIGGKQYPEPFFAPVLTSSNWVVSYFEAAGELPTVPNSLLPLFKDVVAGDKLPLNTEIGIPSAQWWGNLLPSEKQTMLDIIEWYGMPAEDYMALYTRMIPGR